MKKHDLTQLKHIGPSRMKLLNKHGITTFKQLDETPVEKLMEIKSIGEQYAKQIKDAAAEYYGAMPEQFSKKATPGDEKGIVGINGNLSKRVKVLNKRLKKARESLKPLGKKKYLEPYIELKIKSNKLKSRLKDLEQIAGNLSKEVKEDVIRNADALSGMLKSKGKKPKKKNYEKLLQEIKAFSKKLRETLP